MKSLYLVISTAILMLTVDPSSLGQGLASEAGTIRISNLVFSDNPVTPGVKFIISFEFEGDVDRLFIENTFETQGDEIKKEIKEYSISPEIKAHNKGIIKRQWETQRGSTAKPYRILSVWVKDAKGNQSNVLSGEIKIATAMPANLLGEIVSAGETPKNNTIEIGFYKVELHPDYKFVGKLRTQEENKDWVNNRVYNASTIHNLFVKTNTNGKVQAFVIVRNQTIEGNISYATEPKYDAIKDYIYKGNTEVLGSQTRTVVLRVNKPHPRYIEMMRLQSIEVDSSYPKLVCYMFGKLAGQENLLEILCYFGEKTIDNDEATAYLKEIGQIVKLTIK